MPDAPAVGILGKLGEMAGVAVRKLAPGNGLPRQEDAFKDEIKEAEEFFQDALSEQKAYHRVWYRNIAYFMGLQWMDWDDRTNNLIEPPAPSWRVRFVANLIMPTIRTEAAKILRTQPNFQTIPGNDSQEARHSAKIGNRVLEAKFYEDDFQRKLYNLTMWFLTCGHSFLWSLWDGTRGRSWSDMLKDPATGQPMMGPDGQPVRKTFFEGDLLHDVSSPFETLMEPGAPEDFNEHRRIMRYKLRSLSYVKDRYGVELPADDIKNDVLLQIRLARLVSGSAAPVSSTPSALKNLVMVKEYFELPTMKNPEGRNFVYAGGRILAEPRSIDYYLRGERALPCGKFDHITVPGRAYPISIIEQIAPLNLVYNKMNSQVIENANLLSRPKVLSPEGSLSEDHFTTEPGEIVEYRPIGGMKPEPFKPPEMPQYFFLMKDAIPGMIDTVSGIFDVSRGKLPRRATSGRAIDLLQEADETRIALTIRNFASSLERTMSISLATMGRKYSEQRTLKKVGPSHEVEVITFRGADLRDADTVRVFMGASLSRAAKSQLGLELRKEGLISKDTLMKILELGDINMAFDVDSDQISYARIENMGMAKGIIYNAGQYEPHQAHKAEHTEFLNSEIGQKLPLEIRQIFDQHIAEHDAFESPVAGGVMPQQDFGAPLPPSGVPPMAEVPGQDLGGL